MKAKESPKATDVRQAQFVFGDRTYSLEPEARFVALGRRWFPLPEPPGGRRYELHARSSGMVSKHNAFYILERRTPPA